MWIFGYGSLMWKTNFNYEQSIAGYIKGYIRRFWQSSEDHRGVPGAIKVCLMQRSASRRNARYFLLDREAQKPGRVVTIILSNNPQDCVYGVAYKIAEKDVSEVLEYLDYREKDGYEQRTVVFHPCDTAIKSFELKIYIADKINPFYVGPAPLEDIAHQILNSVGPSGRNDEYLFQLAETMRTLVPHVNDEHLFELEKLVNKLKNTVIR